MGLEAETSFAHLSAGVPATVGAAIAAPEGVVRSFGEWSSGVAWSTIKVPLALAALRGDPSQAKPLLNKVITESDNSASEALWSLLGPPTDAARRVQAVIEEAGDSVTVVESQTLRAGFTPFGQTHWSLVRQADFAARLPSLSGAGTVIDLMHQLVAAQRWGLAAIGIATKGGWGPGVRGDYLVRQFGIVPSAAGHVGVALAARSDSFATGVDVVNTLADWVVNHLTEQ